MDQNPQVPQLVSGHNQETVYIPGVGFRTTEPGESVEQLVARVKSQPPSLVGEPRSNAQIASQRAASDRYVGSQDMLKDAAGAGLDLSMLGVGTMFGGPAGMELPAVASRMSMLAPLGAAKGAMTGEGALHGATSAAATEGVPAFLANKLPYGAFKTALHLGGVRNPSEAAEAFARQFSRSKVGEGINVGRDAKLMEHRLRIGNEIQNAEEAAPPHTVDSLRSVAGYTGDQADRAINASHPLDIRDILATHEKNTLEQQAVGRAGGSNADLAAMRDRDAAAYERSQRRPMVAPGQQAQASYDAAKAAAGARGVMTTPHDQARMDAMEAMLKRFKGEERPMQGPLPAPRPSIDTLIDQTPLTVRDMGEMKRSAAHKADSVLEARARHGFIPEGDLVNTQSEADLAKRMRDLQEKNLDPTHWEDLNNLNKDASDLHTMDEANKALKGGGGVMVSPGQMGVRGGLGSGVAQNVANVTGSTGWQNFAGIGAIAGLAPRTIGGAGMIASRLAAFTPTALRLKALSDDLKKMELDNSHKTPVQRRKP